MVVGTAEPGDNLYGSAYYSHPDNSPQTEQGTVPLYGMIGYER
jgi:hypothetical protein